MQGRGGCGTGHSRPSQAAHQSTARGHLAVLPTWQPHLGCRDVQVRGELSCKYVATGGLVRSSLGSGLTVPRAWAGPDLPPRHGIRGPWRRRPLLSLWAAPLPAHLPWALAPPQDPRPQPSASADPGSGVRAPSLPHPEPHLFKLWGPHSARPPSQCQGRVGSLGPGPHPEPGS